MPVQPDIAPCELDERSAPAHPLTLFGEWYQEVEASELFTNPGAAQLSTATASGMPSSRVVLLKHFDEEGFVFYTNYGSRKAQEMAENPQVAFSFYWQHFERQVRIEGRVERLPVAQSIAYFLKRPRQSQIGAWASAQSKIIEARDQLERQFDSWKRKLSTALYQNPKAGVATA